MLWRLATASPTFICGLPVSSGDGRTIHLDPCIEWETDSGWAYLNKRLEGKPPLLFLSILLYLCRSMIRLSTARRMTAAVAMTNVIPRIFKPQQIMISARATATMIRLSVKTIHTSLCSLDDIKFISSGISAHT